MSGLAGAAIDALLNRVIDATSAKPKAGGGYIGHCPAHDDKSPSLSIDVVDGRILVKCWAGCTQESVIGELRAEGAWYDTKPPVLSPAEREAARVRSEAAKAERLKDDQARRNKATIRGQKIYDAANALNPAQHSYAIKKGVPFGGRVKRGYWPQRKWDDALIIPIYDSEKRLTSIQAINGDGEKDFLAGGRVKGCFYPIGKITSATGYVFIGEGLATVAAVVHVMGGAGVVALNAGNLESVARVIKEMAPDAEIIILADDDRKEGGHESR